MEGVWKPGWRVCVEGWRGGGGVWKGGGEYLDPLARVAYLEGGLQHPPKWA